MESDLVNKFSECDAIFAKLADNPHKELLVSVQVCVTEIQPIHFMFCNFLGNFKEKWDIDRRFDPF